MSTPALATRPAVAPPAPWGPPLPSRSRVGGVTVLAYDMPGSTPPRSSATWPPPCSATGLRSRSHAEPDNGSLL
jgi:hypothetical protein